MFPEPANPILRGEVAGLAGKRLGEQLWFELLEYSAALSPHLPTFTHTHTHTWPDLEGGAAQLSGEMGPPSVMAGSLPAPRSEPSGPCISSSG